ncbi:prolipoprotein diacylglyceryl transferase [Paracoccaceae bacterium]|nr:prolipoprotein diacylglyceryl transferase [Paracoccaceae bacterium]
MIPFPNINQEIFSFDFLGLHFALRWYAVSYLLGFFCAIKLMKFFVKRNELWVLNKPPLNLNQADSLLTYLILGVILGGRLGYVLFYNFAYYASNPIDILRIWDGGMAFHGGFIGVCLAVLIYCRSNAIPLWSGADLIAVSSPPGLFLGRIANFINAELWGRPTEKPWGVIFPGERAQVCEGIVGHCARHPSQLYEAILEGLLLFILLFILARLGAFKKPGLLTGTFAMWYGFSRFFIEYFRVPDPQFFSSVNPYGFAFRFGDYGVTMGQALSLPMVFSGIIIFIFSTLRNKENT